VCDDKYMHDSSIVTVSSTSWIGACFVKKAEIDGNDC